MKTMNVEVTLPEGVEPTPIERELVRATLSTTGALRRDLVSEWEEAQRQLEAGGWKVRWGLAWRVAAKRGNDYEEATGETLDEAFQQLVQLTRLDDVGHLP